MVDSVSDVVIEAANAGTDTITASVSYTLSANVEAVVLTGSAALNGTGNALANSLTGNAGANLLDGQRGNDTLSGGDGNDVVDETSDTTSAGNQLWLKDTSAAQIGFLRQPASCPRGFRCASGPVAAIR